MLTVAFGSSVAAVVTATLLLSGCSTAGVTGANSAPEVSFQHIHKIETSDVGGKLLIAAHDGLYTITVGSDAEAKVVGPVGDFDFDLMGFAVAGDTIYASGHPGPNTAGVFGTPNLGLISSTDFGTHWTSVSLSGITDFHALSAAADGNRAARVFGIDASKQRIQRSMDGGQTWDEGAELVARDILAAGEQVYATTPDGLAVSGDDGASFVVDEGAPALYIVAAEKAGGLVGVDVNGSVWARDAGGLWTTGGTVTGQPQALAAEGNRIYVADDRGIAFTEDKGSTWTTLVLRS